VTEPAAATLSADATAERAAVAARADRSSRGTHRPLSYETYDAFTFGAVMAARERIERHQARVAAARKARQHQAFLDRWVMPIHSYTWSAGYGVPGSMWESGYHTGQDWTAPYGTPVYAAVRGTITFAGWSDAYGNKLEITNYDGSQSWYGHLSAYERTGGTVKPGTLVGYVGCTGNCYGTHLHFEIHLPDGSDTDPVVWLRRHGVAL